jgi:hypothetical protein
MSTVPGEPAWRDAGLRPVDDDEPVRLTDPAPPVDDPEEYVPGLPRPDLTAGAEEADVVDQGTEVALDDEAEGL